MRLLSTVVFIFHVFINAFMLSDWISTIFHTSHSYPGMWKWDPIQHGSLVTTLRITFLHLYLTIIHIISDLEGFQVTAVDNSFFNFWAYNVWIGVNYSVEINIFIGSNNSMTSWKKSMPIWFFALCRHH